MQVETSFDYSVPNHICFQALKEYVLHNLKIRYRIGYPLIKITTGQVNLKIIKDDFRASWLQAKMEIRAYGIIPYTMGPTLNVYCIVTGANRCSVEFVAESTSATDSQLVNFFLEAAAKLPGYSHLLKSGIMPKIYFDDTVVYDKETYRENNISANMNVRAFKYIFSKADKLLRSYLDSQK